MGVLFLIGSFQDGKYGIIGLTKYKISLVAVNY